MTNAFVQNNLSTISTSTSSSLLSSPKPTPDEVADISAEEAMQRTRNQLQRLQQEGGGEDNSNSGSNPIIDEKFKEYLSFPANEIKKELKSAGLLTKGRKPDLARRLAEYEYRIDHPDAPAYYNPKSSGFADSSSDNKNDDNDANSANTLSTTYLEPKNKKKTKNNSNDDAKVENGILNKFCGIQLSETAGKALGKAQFTTPTPIQKNGLPLMMKGESVVLHAETGSGKTLAYLLPITEAIWRDELASEDANGFVDMNDDNDLRYGLILTPTRELAAQVAGVASALAPPGSVRLISHPTDLMSEARYWKERRGSRTTDAIDLFAEEDLRSGRSSPPRLFIGSAKSILHSLYGDGRMPASPTRKPLAKEMLSKTRWVVLDEVDRLLNTKSKKGLSNNQRGRSTRGGSSKEHEKPAAILTSAVTRRTLGRAQVISASATVGRSLKRELSRVLGLSPKEYPRVIQGTSSGGIISDEEDDETTFIGGSSYSEKSTDSESEDGEENINPNHVNRAVTIPNSVTNYVLAVDTSSTGKLLTNAFFVVKNLNENGKKKNQKTLLVLTKGCGISTKNAIGALTHFNCQPEPQSLLDVLQNADGSDQLMDVHRLVTGSDGIGEDTSYFDTDTAATGTDDDDDDDSSEGFLLVTGEDTVRGMHIANLDTVVVVGRPAGPDEYIHIAGRTGRAGRSGKVISVLSEQHTAAIKGWETILNIDFKILDSMNDISSI